jgi:hypothetical protein
MGQSITIFNTLYVGYWEERPTPTLYEDNILMARLYAAEFGEQEKEEGGYFSDRYKMRFCSCVKRRKFQVPPILQTLSFLHFFLSVWLI